MDSRSTPRPGMLTPFAGPDTFSPGARARALANKKAPRPEKPDFGPSTAPSRGNTRRRSPQKPQGGGQAAPWGGLYPAANGVATPGRQGSSVWIRAVAW